MSGNTKPQGPQPDPERLVSIVVPAYNEAESLSQLYDEIAKTFDTSDAEFEVLIVDDGSNDNTRQILRTLLHDHGEHLEVIRLRRNFGKSAALMEGFRSARGSRIVMMDADLQDCPSEVPKLLDSLNSGYDAVSGWKRNRKDPLHKRVLSKLFNHAVNKISVSQLHDHDCGLKAMRADAARSLDLYGSLYRFMTPLLEASGYSVTEVPVQHRPRQYGHSKFGLARIFEGAFDFLTVIFITRFRHRPLHFFGAVGLGCFASGFLIALYLALYKLIGHHHIGTRPLLFLSLLLMIVGVQVTATGIIGEQLTAFAGGTRNTRTNRRATTTLAERNEQA